jgi:hypothetical protein
MKISKKENRKEDAPSVSEKLLSISSEKHGECKFGKPQLSANILVLNVKKKEGV